MKKLLIIFFLAPQVKAQDVWVNGYVTSEGTYVEGYYRTAPNYTVNDNFSTFGNQNPYTGEWGTKPRDASSNPLNLHPYIPAGNTVTPVALPYKPSIYEYRDYALEARIELDNWKSKSLNLHPSQNKVLYELEHKEDPFQAIAENNYSQNYKDYLYEKEHPRPLKDFEDDKVKFNIYNKPVENTILSTNNNSKSWIMISVILCILSIFTMPLLTKKKKDMANMVNQHPYDGDMSIDLNTVQGVRLSNDDYHAEVLLSDGNWVRLHMEFDKVKKLVSAAR